MKRLREVEVEDEEDEKDPVSVLLLNVCAVANNWRDVVICLP